MREVPATNAIIRHGPRRRNSQSVSFSLCTGILFFFLARTCEYRSRDRIANSYSYWYLLSLLVFFANRLRAKIVICYVFAKILEIRRETYLLCRHSENIFRWILYLINNVQSCLMLENRIEIANFIFPCISQSDISKLK